VALAEASGAAASEGEKALERLAMAGAVLRLKPGIYYHPAVVRQVVAMVTDICEREGSVTIARLRDETGTSRRYAQALLEHLDAERVLLRDADRHLLRGRPTS
jgi:selenocysteine-specific elongation factor